MDNFKLNKLGIDPLLNVKRSVAESMKYKERVGNEISISKEEEIQRAKRMVELQEESVEQNRQLIRLSEIEVGFLKNINGDTSKLINLVKDLENINKMNGTITEANMLLIQQRLDELIAGASPENINQLFLEEVKQQMIDKGVNFGIQFVITGLKTFLTGGIEP